MRGSRRHAACEYIEYSLRYIPCEPRISAQRAHVLIEKRPSDMPKSLIIAEKPSVANDIARVLGGFTKHKDYFERESYVLSAALGHLLEITAPEEYEVKRGKWSFAHLPVIPPHF